MQHKIFFFTLTVTIFAFVSICTIQQHFTIFQTYNGVRSSVTCDDGTCMYKNVCLFNGSLFLLNIRPSDVNVVAVSGSVNDPRTAWKPGVLNDFSATDLQSHNVTSFQKSTAVIMKRHSPGNPAHCIIEASFPAFRLVRKYFGDLQPTQTYILCLDSCDDANDSYVRYSYSAQQCRQSTDKWLGMLSAKPIVEISRSPNMCFENAVAGISVYGVYGEGQKKMAGSGDVIRAYRDLTYNAHGVLHRSLEERVKFPTAVIIDKRGHRRISNVETIAKFVAEKFPYISVSVMDLSTMTVREQLSELSKSFLLITPPGSNSFTAFLMPNQSTVLSAPFCSFTNTSAFLCDQFEVRAFHVHVNYINTVVWNVTSMKSLRVGQTGMLDVEMNDELQLSAIISSSYNALVRSWKHEA